MEGKYQAYPVYDQSGVEWLGKVPAHWRIKPLKYFTNFINGNAFKPSEWSESGTPIIRIENLNGGESFNFYEGAVSDRYRVNKGDLLFGWSGNKGTSFGPFIWWRDGQHYLNQHIYRLEGFNCHKRWFYWILKAATYYIEEQAHGIIGMIHVTKAKLGGICIPSITDEEQRTIAAFLDHETARIDRLIEKQQRLIELLKEKRQAVISHAVTKGLDPNVPMKDSGVEWLGQVPEHWVIRRLKHTAQLQSGIPKGKDLSGKQTISVSMLRVANVQDGYVKLDDVHQIEIEPHELMRYSLQSGDVLMNEGGDNDKLGRGAVWHGQLEPCIHQNHVFAIRVSDIEPEWLSLVTGSKYAKYHFYCVAKQSTNLASISSSNIKETPLVIPPEIERQQIMEYLANMTSKLDQVSEFASRQIALLQERRTALISAAVTGKIDVRNWQPNTSTQSDEPDLPMAAEQAGRYHV